MSESTSFISLQLQFQLYFKSPKHFGITIKFGNKERFDKEQIGIKEPFPVTKLPFTS